MPRFLMLLLCYTAVFAAEVTVSSVGLSGSQRLFSTGDTITILVNFNGAVTVGGTPSLATTIGTATYQGGSESSSLRFTCVVDSSDNADPLNYPSSAALSGGSISPVAAGDTINTTLPDPGSVNSLGGEAAVVDTTAPAVSRVYSPLTSGAYRAAQTIPIMVEFSEPITVDTGYGTPELKLQLNGFTRRIVMDGTEGDRSLRFLYVVAAADETSPLDYASTGSLLLNSAIIHDADLASQAANATLPSPGSAHSLSTSAIAIDTTPPTISSIAVTTLPANNPAETGDTATIRITFSESIELDGPGPDLALNSGGTAQYTSTSSNTIDLVYTVATDENSDDLDYVSSTMTLPTGSSLTDRAGNQATLTLPTPGATGSLSGQYDIQVGNGQTNDTTPPTISQVSAPSNTYGLGDSCTITVRFSETLQLTDNGVDPTLTLANGGTATFTQHNGADLVFTYTVASGDGASTDLDYSSTGALTLNDTTLSDGAGNSASATLPAPGASGSLAQTSTVVIDVEAVPRVIGVGATGGNGSFTIDDEIEIAVTFSEPVTIESSLGLPSLRLSLDNGQTRTLVLDRYDAHILRFVYTVAPSENSSRLAYSGSDALQLNGAVIRDASGLDATLGLPAPGQAGSLSATNTVIIDTIAPTVSALALTSTDGSYASGDDLTFLLTMSENVNLQGGRLELALNSGGKASTRDVLQTSTIRLDYRVGSADDSNDLDYLDSAALRVVDGSLSDRAGNAAILTLPDPGSIAAAKAVIIGAGNDVIQPVIEQLSARAGADGDSTFLLGEAITITVRCSEGVQVSGGRPTLLLSNGGTAIFSGSSDGGGSTRDLLFQYTVAVGDSATNDLDQASSNALSLAGATITDAAGNDLRLSLPGAGAHLAATSAVVITLNDLVGFTAVAPDQPLPIDSTLTFSLHLSKDFILNGEPRLALATGADGPRYAQYVGNDLGSRTISFSYRVATGDQTTDLACLNTSALDLQGGTLTDAGGTALNTTLPVPGSPGSLSGDYDIPLDTAGPQILRVEAQTDGLYRTDDYIRVNVIFDETVTIDSLSNAALWLAAEASGAGVEAEYLAGDGSDTIVFRYLVQADDRTSDLAYTGQDALRGTYRDAAGNPSDNELASPGEEGSLSQTSNVLINIEDTTPVVSIATVAAVAETGIGEGRQATAFLISISPTSDQALTIGFSASGSATRNVDYTLIPASVQVPANTSAFSLTIDISGDYDDSDFEGDETITLTLEAAENSTYRLPEDDGTRTSSATVSISDNERYIAAEPDSLIIDSATWASRLRITSESSSTLSEALVSTLSGPTLPWTAAIDGQHLVLAIDEANDPTNALAAQAGIHVHLLVRAKETRSNGTETTVIDHQRPLLLLVDPALAPPPTEVESGPDHLEGDG